MHRENLNGVSMSTLLAALACFLAPAQDDRATILDGVESWYKVVQDGKNKGYVREKLERVRDHWTYSYRVDFILDIPDPKDATRTADLVEFRDVQASLDEAFLPRTLLSHVEGSRDFSIATAEEKRTLAVGDRTVEIPADTDLFALPTFSFYSMRQNGMLAKEGRRSARLLSPLAEGRVDVEMTFDVGAPVRKEVMGAAKMLTPVRFLKPPAASHPDATWSSALVDKYGRIVEIAMRGGAKIALVEDDLAAFKAAVNMHRSDRHDPFEHAKARKGDSTPFPDETPGPRVSADGLMSALADAKRDLKELEGMEAAGKPEAYLKLLQLWKAVREKARALGRDDMVVEADRVRNAAEAAWDGAARALADARRCNVRLLEAHQRTDAGALEREVRALKDQGRRIEFELRPESEEVAAWISQAGPMVARCRTRAELAKIPLVVSGTVISRSEEPISIEIAAGVSHSVRFVRDTSTAVINSKTCRVGDVVDGVRLEKVSTYSVTVSLRGELREVPLGR
jgi:hypothetical protein